MQDPQNPNMQNPNDSNTVNDVNNGPIVPEMVDPRETPQYKAYEAQQVAKSHLNEDTQKSKMVQENPAVLFSGNVKTDTSSTATSSINSGTSVVETPLPPITPVTSASPVDAGKSAATVVDNLGKVKHSDRLLVTMFALLGGLLVIAGGFVVFLFTAAGVEFLSGFGLDIALRNVLLTIVMIVVALLAMSGLAFGLIQMLKAPKTELKVRKHGFALSLLSGFMLLVAGVTLGILILLPNGQTLRIDDYIVTEPAILRDLTAPTEVSFDATGIPYDAEQFEVLGYQWSFGDGDRATGSKVTHTFTKKPEGGVYDVQLTLIFKNIASGEQLRQVITKQVAISNATANLQFTATPDFGTAPLTIKVDAGKSTDPDGEIVTFEWDFEGDGIIDEEGTTAEFTYDSNGDYNLTLLATDTNGQVTKASKKIVVADDAGFKIGYNISPEAKPMLKGVGYQFDASESEAPDGDIIDYQWTFSDGTPTQRGKKVTHTFNNDGEYTVTLRLTTEANRSYAKEFKLQVGKLLNGPQVELKSVPAADEDGVIRGNSPLSVTFSADPLRGNAEKVIDYAWDFDGDGKSDANGTNVRHVFAEPGKYNVQLVVTNTKKETNSFSTTVEVGNREVEAKLKADTVAGDIPLTVSFDASSSTTSEDDPIVSFIWDFGDGSEKRRDNAQITYLYKQVGSYNATVTAITATGKASTARILITVNPVSLKACYTASRKSGKAPVIIEFSPHCSTGVISGYRWDFGDGNESIDRQPVHEFSEPGIYEVTLTLENNNVSDTFTDRIVVD